jgi:hypothetical protein
MTDTAKHTPGPWEIYPGQEAQAVTDEATGKVWVNQAFWIMCDREGRRTRVGEIQLCTSHDGYGSVDNAIEARANANLVTAAPDMAEALQRIASDASVGDDAQNKNDRPSEIARVALAKAGIT